MLTRLSFSSRVLFFFFLNDPPPPEIYPLSLPGPFPIFAFLPGCRLLDDPVGRRPGFHFPRGRDRRGTCSWSRSFCRERLVDSRAGLGGRERSRGSHLCGGPSRKGRNEIGRASCRERE